MLLFKHKSYHKLQIYAYMISWLRVLELENTKGLMNLRKRLGMSFKCWLRQWPFADKISPALESSPSLGEGRRQTGQILPQFQACPQSWWQRGPRPSLPLCWQSQPSPGTCPAPCSPLSQGHAGGAASGERVRRLKWKNNIYIYWKYAHTDFKTRHVQDKRVNKCLQQSAWRWQGLRSSREGAGPALCWNLAVTRISCRKQSFQTSHFLFWNIINTSGHVLYCQWRVYYIITSQTFLAVVQELGVTGFLAELSHLSRVGLYLVCEYSCLLKIITVLLLLKSSGKLAASERLFKAGSPITPPQWKCSEKSL